MAEILTGLATFGKYLTANSSVLSSFTLLANQAIVKLFGLQTATAGATVATGALGTAISLLPIAGLVAGVVIAVKVLDKLIVTASEAQEAFEKSVKDYEEGQTEMANIEQELANISDRISEIKSKGTLSFTDKSTLADLEATTAQLLLQKKIIEEQNKEKAKAVVNNSKDAFEKKYEGFGYSDTSVENKYNNRLENDYYSNSAKYGGATNKNDISGLIADYKILNEEIESAEKNGNLSDSELNKKMEERTALATDLWEHYNGIKEYRDEIDEAGGLSVLEGEQIDYYNNLTEAMGTILKGISSESYKSFAFADALKKDEINQVTTELISLANAGELTTDTLNDNKYSSFVSEMENAGLTAEDLYEQIMSLSTTDAKVTVETEQARAEMSSVIETIQLFIDETTALNDAYNGTGIALQIDQLSELDDAYLDAISYANGYLKLDREKSKQITKNLADEKLAYLDTQKAMAQAEYLSLSKDIDKLTESQRKELQAIENQIVKYDVMADQIRQATGAYQGWLDAQNASESGDMYDDVVSAYEAIQEGQKSGKIGTNKYKTAIEFLIPEASREDEKAVKKYMSTLKRYITEDGTGANNFITDAIKKGLMSEDAKGNVEIVAGTTQQQFMDALKITPEMAQAIFGELEEYGWEFNWGDENLPTSVREQAYEVEQIVLSLQDELEQLKLDPQVNKDKILEVEKELNKALGLRDELSTTRNLNIKTYFDTDGKLQKAQEKLQTLKKEAEKNPNDVKIKADISEAENEIARLQREKDALEEPTTVEVDAEIGSIDNQLSEIEKRIIELTPTLSTDPKDLINNAINGSNSIALDISPTTLQEIQALQVEKDRLCQEKEALVSYQTAITDAQTLSGEVDALGNNIEQVRTVNIDVATARTRLGEIQNSLNNIKDKTITVTTNNVTAGNAQLNGTAYANGNWGATTGGRALIGELGREIVVDPRSGQWRTYGDNGAEFADIPKGAIVFNHKQTESLLERGFVNQRGSAYLNGTAFVGGGGSRLNVTQNKTTSTKTTSKNTDKDTETKKSKLETILDKLSELFDFVEIRLSRASRATQKATDKIEDYTTAVKKNAQINKALKANTTEQSANKKAYDKYMSQAGSVASQTGLSKSVVSKIQNGSIDIKSYGENTQKAIQEYQTWYEKALDCKDAIDELKRSQKELNAQKLTNIQDQYSTLQSIIDTTASLQESKLSLREAKGNSETSDYAVDIYKQQKSTASKTVTNKQKEYSSYKKELDKQLKSGAIKAGSMDYKNAMSYLESLQADIYNAQAEVVQYEDLIKNNLATKYDYSLSRKQSEASAIENRIETNKATGKPVSEKDYKSLVKNSKEQVSIMKLQNAEYVKQQSGLSQNSAKYKALQEKIDANNDAIASATQSQYEYNKSIRDMRWESYNKTQDGIQNTKDDIDGLIDMIQGDLVDEDGNITKAGLAKVGLLGQQISESKQAIANYRQALSALEKEKANGNITADEYEEESRAIIKSIQSEAKNIQSYNDSILEVTKSQLQAEADALIEVTNKRKSALQAKKAYYDYDKTIKSKTKDINSLKQQISALEGIDNAEAKAQLARLKKQLGEAQEDLQDTKTEHAYELKIEGYDQMTEDINTNLETQLSSLENNLNLQQQAVSNMLSSVKDNYNVVYSEINTIADTYGLELSKAVTSPWESAKNALNSYKEAMATVDATKANVSVSSSKIDTQTPSSQTQTASTGTGNSNTPAKAPAKAPTNASNGSDAPKAPTNASNGSNTPAKTPTVPANAKVSNAKSVLKRGMTGDEVKMLQRALKGLKYKGSDKKDLTVDGKFGANTEYAVKQFQKASKLTQDGMVGSKTKSAFKVKGYKNGTLYSDNEIARIDEIGKELIMRNAGKSYTVLTRGSSVIPADITKNLMEQGRYSLKELMGEGVNKSPTVMSNSVSPTTVTNHYDCLLKVEGNVDKDTLPRLEEILKQSYEYNTKMFAKEYSKLGNKRKF